MRNKIVEEDLDYIINSNLPWSDFENRTVLISGANGFLPAYLVETLLFLNEKRFKNKTKVICLVRNKEKAERKFAHHLNNKNLNFLVQDVCASINIKGNIDFIIHAASQASPKYYGLDPVGTLSANIIGTRNLLELGKEKDVQSFLYFSSGEVYGQLNDNQVPTNEDDYGYLDPTEVRSCYAESKRMGENMCVSWFHQYRLPAKIARPFHTYGPGMDLNDGRVFADFVSDVVNQRNIIMKSDGTATRAFCYLADATIGFFTVLLKGENGQAYNVGNDEGEISILNLAELLVGLFPEKGLAVERKIRSDNSNYIQSKLSRGCPDITKIRRLGWKPNYSIAEGFKRTITSFLQL